MPIHDWTRVDAGIVHAFHRVWITHFQEALNAGLLPPDYYALGEQIAGPIGPDVLTLQTPNGHNGGRRELPGAVAVAVTPPPVQFTVRAEIDEYALKRRTVVIRHSSNHRIVALIEIVSPGNKSSRHAIRSFLDKTVAALAQGIHLLVIDLHPPSPRDPHGIHAALWERLTETEFVPPADKPLTLAAYAAGAVPTAYVQPIAVEDSPPDMPLFLDPEQYINVPLRGTYDAAYNGVPLYYRRILEGAGAG
jgi:hypothetical protein